MRRADRGGRGACELRGRAESTRPIALYNGGGRGYRGGGWGVIGWAPNVPPPAPSGHPTSPPMGPAQRGRVSPFLGRQQTLLADSGEPADGSARGWVRGGGG